VNPERMHGIPDSQGGAGGRDTQNGEASLLVTLADENFVDAVKQVFASAALHGGWKGDYMLLSYRISESTLGEFEHKGVLVYRLGEIGSYHDVWGPAAGRLVLFREEFKKWRKIVYIDGDTIVRNGLARLLSVNNFSAVHAAAHTMTTQFGTVDNVPKSCDPKAPAFNAGVFAFDTGIVEKDTYRDIRLLQEMYPGRFNEQSALNLFFYDRWVKLPRTYNVYPSRVWPRTLASPKRIPGVILHFASKNKDLKPWEKTSPFYKEWAGNLESFKTLDFTRDRVGSAYEIPGWKHWIGNLYLCLSYELYGKKKRLRHKSHAHRARIVGYLNQKFPRLTRRARQLRRSLKNAIHIE